MHNLRVKIFLLLNLGESYMVKILTSKIFSIFIAVILLGGCANGFHPLSGLGLNLHNQEFWKAYNTAIEKFEGEAEAGKITWVEAATKMEAKNPQFPLR